MSPPTRAWPSEKVIDAAQRGDPVAIATLVSGSHAHVRRFAHILCATPDDAEEATQEALILLYRKIGTLRATAALASWVVQIVRNECVRRTRLTFHRPASADSAGPSAEATLTPASLPRRSFAPIEAHLRGSVATADGSHG